MTGTAIGGQLGIWGTTGTTVPRVQLLAEDAGGSMTLCDSNDVPTIVLHASPSGDNAAQLPYASVNSDETSEEAAVVQERGTSCVTVDSLFMQDLAVVTVSCPTSGYIMLTGSGMVEFSGTTTLNRIDVQIDQTSGGGSTNGYFERIGLADYGGTSYSSFSFSVQRTYYVTSGPHTFRLEARRLGLNGTASTCWPVLRAIFVPTSYGAVSTVASGGPGSDNYDGGTRAVPSNPGASADSKDLRELEMQAKEARRLAEDAERRLREARLSVGKR